MDQVPCEAHSVPLLLDSLLRQVEATVDQKDPMNEPKPPREDMLDHSLGEYLDGKLNQLGLKKIPRSKVVASTFFSAKRAFHRQILRYFAK